MRLSAILLLYSILITPTAPRPLSNPIEIYTANHLTTASNQFTTTSSSAATSNRDVANPFVVVARAESYGSSCSSEGQWNCMTNSWQRCASGRWSVEMDCAMGTVCTPSGLTDDFRIEHDGSVNGRGGGGTSGGTQGVSRGPRGSVNLLLLSSLGVAWTIIEFSL